MSAQEKHNIAIVTVKLTTDGINELKETHDIIVEAEHEHLFQEKALCRMMPTNQLMIVRTHDGKYVRREKGVGTGVSLTSYLYGKTHMRRVDPTDLEDYSLGAFQPNTGKPQAIELLLHKEAFNPIGYMWNDVSSNLEEVNMADTENTEVDLTKSLKPFKPVSKMTIPNMNAELVDIVNRIAAAKKIRVTGAKANCPCCGVEFTKSHGITIFCSSTSQGDKNGCKDQLNSRKSELRKAIEAKGGKVDPAALPRSTKPQKSTPAPQAAVVNEEKPKVNDGVFKVIGGVPFTLAETKDLMFTEKDRPNFKTHRGITFSLSEMRKLILE